MADTTTSQVLISGPRNLVVKLTSVSDGTGEAAVIKVNVAAFTPSPGVHLTVKRIDYSIQGMLVRLQWQATVNIDMEVLQGYGNMNFDDFGGLVCPLVAGATGSILLTTQGQVAGSSYDLILSMRKNVM